MAIAFLPAQGLSKRGCGYRTNFRQAASKAERSFVHFYTHEFLSVKLNAP